MSLQYPVIFERDDNGTFLITCPLLPEVTTFAEGEADWHKHATDAIEEAIAARVSAWQDTPIAGHNDFYQGGGNRVATISLQASMKLMLFRQCKLRNVSRAELARLLGWHREQVDRLFRLDHATRLDQFDMAMRAAGGTYKFVGETDEAA